MAQNLDNPAGTSTKWLKNRVWSLGRLTRVLADFLGLVTGKINDESTSIGISDFPVTPFDGFDDTEADFSSFPGVDYSVGSFEVVFNTHHNRFCLRRTLDGGKTYYDEWRHISRYGKIIFDNSRYSDKDGKPLRGRLFLLHGWGPDRSLFYVFDGETLIPVNGYPDADRLKLSQLPEKKRLDIEFGKKVDKEKGKGLSTNDFSDEYKSTLEQCVTSNPADDELEDIEPDLVTNALRKNEQYLTPEEQAQVKRNLDISKTELFDDLWLKSGLIHGIQYSGIDREGNPEAPYILNGIQGISYDTAMDILQRSCIGGRSFRDRQYYGVTPVFDMVGVPTLFPICLSNLAVLNYMNNGGLSFDSVECLTIIQDGQASAIYQAFSGCRNLKHILGVINCGSCTGKIYLGDYLGDSLAEIQLSNVKVNVDFSNLRKISLDSLDFLLTHAANTSAITITVHPEVYSKLTDAGNEEWNDLLALAASKNIQFASA